MSVSSYTDVWCDVCGVWEERATSKSGREARKAAREYGWRINLPGGLDVCPRCVAEGKAPTAALGSYDPAPGGGADA